MKNVIILLVMAFSVIGCTGPDNTFDWSKPVAINTNPPEGPYNYRKGWNDGCQSGLAATNTFFQMSLKTKKFTLDEKLRYDRLYNAGWKYAYNHCGYSMRSLAMYSF